MTVADTRVKRVLGQETHAADEGGLAALHRRHYTAMVRLASVYVDDVESAEEVVQDAFLKMVKGRRRPEPGREVFYLRAAVLNGARSVLRRRRVVRLKLPRMNTLDVEAAETSTMRRGDQDRLWRAVMELPENQAAVLVLRYYENLSEAEIAEVLGIARGSVKSHAHRALRKLETKMGADR